MGEQNEAVEPEVLAVQTFNGPPPTTQHILAMAVQQGADVAVLEKLMDLQERWEKGEAKKAFVAAMAEFKQEAPAVLAKDGEVDFTSSKGRTHYKHSTLGGVISQITALLGKHGLSVSWSTGQQNGSITVTCHVTHVRGHSESVTLSGPPDDSGNKNRIQQVGSTVTYLQRYTVLAVLGFATAEQDDDGIGSNGKAVVHMTQGQADEIAAHVKRLGIKAPDWRNGELRLLSAGINRLSDMSEDQTAALIKRLSAAKSKADLKKTAPKAKADPLLSGKAPGQAAQTPEEALGIEPDEIEPEPPAEKPKAKGELEHVCPGCGCADVKMGKGAFNYICTGCGQEFKD